MLNNLTNLCNSKSQRANDIIGSKVIAILLNGQHQEGSAPEACVAGLFGQTFPILEKTIFIKNPFKPEAGY